MVWRAFVGETFTFAATEEPSITNKVNESEDVFSTKINKVVL